MSDSLPPLPMPRDRADEPLLQLGSRADADEPCLRADAARNRARLLEAAARLVEQHGAAGVTMEAVAVAAQVGKGTVFRRFGDRTGLLTALLDHSEKKLQAAFLAGPPPLGPGRRPSSGCGRSVSRCCAGLSTNWSCNWPPKANRAAASRPHRAWCCPAMSPCCCGRRFRTPTANSWRKR